MYTWVPVLVECITCRQSFFVYCYSTTRRNGSKDGSDLFIAMRQLLMGENRFDRRRVFYRGEGIQQLERQNLVATGFRHADQAWVANWAIDKIPRVCWLRNQYQWGDITLKNSPNLHTLRGEDSFIIYLFTEQKLLIIHFPGDHWNLNPTKVWQLRNRLMVLLIGHVIIICC